MRVFKVVITFSLVILSVDAASALSKTQQNSTKQGKKKPTNKQSDQI